MSYFFENIDRISAADYEAKDQDYLRTRVRTTGVVTSAYKIKSVNFEFYDVGGQRNERRKWIHFFDDVTAVMYVAAISEYDQTLFEDQNTNRMLEALDLWSQVCELEVFEDSAMILFLNKKDLFLEKIAEFPIQNTPAFEDFSPPPRGQPRPA